MDSQTIIAVVSIFTAGLTVMGGSVGPALGEGKAVVAALDAIARQPEAAPAITRTLFVGMAMVESTAIYCLVIALVVLFANPFV
jgi:F-type H+-transporting ATPase subunit c